MGGIGSGWGGIIRWGWVGGCYRAGVVVSVDMQPCMDALVQQVVQADVHVSLDEIVSLGIVYVFSHVDLDPA